MSYTTTGCQPVACVMSVTSNEPTSGTGDGDLSPDWQVLGAQQVNLRAERASDGAGRIYTVAVTCTDAQNRVTSETVPVVSAYDIASPPSGTVAALGSTLNFAGTFWDVPGTTHQASWDFGGSSTPGTVTEPSGLTSGGSSASRAFPSAGVYTVRMNLTDNGNVTSYVDTRGDLPALVAIYTAQTGGYAAAGGWYTSIAGAYPSKPSATGKMGFGFVSDFGSNPNNPSNPHGSMRFSFGQGPLTFTASSITSVTIAGSKAVFKGPGNIAGDPKDYDYVLAVTDGAFASGGTDRIRLKIARHSNGNVVYDTQPGAADSADPTTAVAPGSTILLDYAGSALAAPMDAALPVSFALEPVRPNPSRDVATLRYALPAEAQVSLRVYDVAGRCVATPTSGIEAAGQRSARLNVGGLANGIYFCRFEARAPGGSALLHAETRKLLVSH